MNKFFTKWWETEQRRFHCGQFNDKEIAYSSWLAGIVYYTRKHTKKIKQGKPGLLPAKN